MRVVFLGAPGSGKSVQAEKFARKFRVPVISAVDLLKDAVAAGTPLGRWAQEAVATGHPVPDELMVEMVTARLRQSDARKGFVLDGFPRNLTQLQVLESFLGKAGEPLDLAILIDVDLEICMQRLVGRRNCRSCDRVFNIYFTTPKIDGRCDYCGGALRHRADDREETVTSRARLYELQTMPLVEHLGERKLLHVIQGVGAVGDVFKAVGKLATTLRSMGEIAPVSPVKAGAKKTAKKSTAKKVSPGKATAGSAVANAGKKAGGRVATKKKTAKKSATVAGKKAAPRKNAKKATTAKKAAGSPATGKTAKKKATVKKASSTGKTAAPKGRRTRTSTTPKAAPRRQPGTRKSSRKAARR